MRTGAWSRGAAVLLCATVLLAGCSKPAGVDGDLTNNWPAMGEAKAAVPDAGKTGKGKGTASSSSEVSYV